MSLQEIVAALAAVDGMAENLPVYMTYPDKPWAHWMHDGDPINDEAARAIVDGVCCRWLAAHHAMVYTTCGMTQVVNAVGDDGVCESSDFTEAAALACVAIGGGA